MCLKSDREKLGLMVLSHHPKAAFGVKKRVSLWLRSGSPNRNLAILTALQLMRDWDAEVNLVSVLESEDERLKTKLFQKTIIERGRMPANTKAQILEGDFDDILQRAPLTDLNFFGLSEKMVCESMRRIVKSVNTSCLFVKDSGDESALV
ncbi:MAG: hypothetical protein P9M03_05900 [Candidatus Theseobacter exili]|nr:hypothetical protein [Candidatus Theseobacter exili]